MKDINELKEKINDLYQKKLTIHVDVHSKRPRTNVDNVPATITGAYKNLFTIEVFENGIINKYSVQYTDLFIGKVKIKELDE